MFNPGDPQLIDDVSEHIARHVAPVESVFHEIVSESLHIDVHWVPPSARRQYHTLVTSGMSARAMKTPAEMKEFGHAELAILLDPDWPVSMRSFEQEANYWPIRLLKTLARFPFENDTWLGHGHTVAAANPPAPFADSTELAACILLPPLSLGEEFWHMTRPQRPDVYFWGVVPIFPEELQLKIESGADALMDALDRTGIDDVVRQSRPRAGTRRRWLGIF
jgi:hypothetical protein